MSWNIQIDNIILWNIIRRENHALPYGETSILMYDAYAGEFSVMYDVPFAYLAAAGGDDCLLTCLLSYIFFIAIQRGGRDWGSNSCI